MAMLTGDRLMRTVLLAALMCLLPLQAMAKDSAGDASGPTETAIFAGGCFWCVESDFDQVTGVVSTVSGYIGGHVENPSYRDVVSETSGHREAVRIEFDPAKISYDKLLDVFWHSVDPTDAGGQFCDRGESYTTAIFTTSVEQAALAAASKETIASKVDKPIATLVKAAPMFWPAEDYHQDYYEKNPVRYKVYRLGCRRDARVRGLWGESAHRGIEAH